MTAIGGVAICAYCRHPDFDHLRAPGGKLRICRHVVTYGTKVDIRLCGCRAFRRPDTAAAAVS